MLVRILNYGMDYDKWFDCRTASVVLTENKKKEFCLIMEFVNGTDATIVLDKGDEIYYMNNEGKTIHKDYRCKI